MKVRRYIILFLTFIILFPFSAGAQNNKSKEKKKEKPGGVQLDFFGDTIKRKDTIKFVPSGLNKEQELCRIIGAKYPVPVINYEPVKPPKFWTTGVLDEIGFSQVSLTNWAAGGSGSLALNAYVNAMANYEKGKMYWENRLQMEYGFVKSFDLGYRKSSDKIILDSKWGYQAYKKLYFSAAVNFRSQFSPGFEYNSKNVGKKVSKFLAPAYLTFGVGMDYKPGAGKVFSLNFSPVTASVVIVNADSLIRVKYGNDYDKLFKWELGAQLKATLQKELLKDFKVATQLTLFSDYMGKPQNIKVNWDVQLDYAFNKYLKASFRTNLIYDDNILIANKAGHECPRVQFKEVFSLNFSYTIGSFKK